MFNKIEIFALAAMALLFADAASAQNCTLKQYASLPLTAAPDGELTVPVTIAGHESMVVVGLSDSFSFLYKSFVDSAGLNTKAMPEGVQIQFEGGQGKRLALVPELKIGSAIVNDAQFVRVDGLEPSGPGIIGEIGEDILQLFDAEFDFGAMRPNLYSHDHCPGAVYWADSYASAPLDFDKSGHPSVTMQLDGKPISVGFFANGSPGKMAMATAKRVFGLDEHSPGVTPIQNRPGLYEYPFKELSIGGLTIGNPKILLDSSLTDCRPKFRFTLGESDDSFGEKPDVNLAACFGVSEVGLHLAELSKLHLFFAFKEKMLYLTAANAKKQGEAENNKK